MKDKTTSPISTDRRRAIKAAAALSAAPLLGFPAILRAQMEQKYLGKFIAVDIDSGDYALGEKPIEAIAAIRAKRPEALVYVARIGQETAYTLGGTIAARDR